MTGLPDKIYYQQQTKNAIANFGSQEQPYDFIRAFAEVKKSCIKAIQTSNTQFEQNKYQSILTAIDLIISGEYNDQFRVPFKQGSAGTSLNMNFNEVIASLAEKIYYNNNQQTVKIDPIEDINLYQSTNDVFPTAVTIMTYRHLLAVEQVIINLQEELITRENLYTDILITGRTEMQTALPILLGQVFGSWAGAIQRDRWRLNKLKERIRSIPLGGTAIGTCFFAPQKYIFLVEQEIRNITNLPLYRSQNLPDEIANLDKFSELAAAYNIIGQNLFKISSDLILYTSSLVQEIKHPHLQYGSTIMAAKSNPVILEQIKGLAIDIQGDCNKIAQYCQNGQLQLNPFLPFITECFINIQKSLITAVNSLINNFLNKLEIQQKNIEKNLINSYAFLNSLLPVIGYNKVKNIYKKLENKNLETLEQLTDFLKNEEDLDDNLIDYHLNPANVTTFTKDYLKDKEC